MQRRGVKIVLLALVAALLTAPIVAAQDLTVWTWSAIRREQFAAIIDWYKEENPGLNIELQEISGSQAEFTEKLTLAIAAAPRPI